MASGADKRRAAERERSRAVSALAEARPRRARRAGARPCVAALGSDPTRREVALVARAIRSSGDERALALFPADDVHFDHVGPVQELAVRAGVDAFVALDLYTEVVFPGWSPFPESGREH